MSHHADRHDPDEDPRHDLGLVVDLATMGIAPGARLVDPRFAAPASYGRRRALQVLAGGASALVLAACGGGKRSSSASSSSTTAAARSGETAAATSEIPDETGGPYPADGTNGPDVLRESGVVRSDIRSSFGPYSGTATGVPLRVELQLVHAGTGSPYGGAALYLWHCDAAGRYSLYSQGATNQNYCRGVQAADANGELAFTTVFPAAYRGRYPHLHVEVFSSVADATTASGKVKTTQLALPAAACDTVYATSGYPQSRTNFAQTPLDRDMVFGDGASLQMATVTGDANGMTATLTVAV